MRDARAFLTVIAIALTASGCMRSFPPARAVAVAPQAAHVPAPVRSDLDNYAYGQAAAPVAVAPQPVAVAPPPVVVAAPPPPPPPVAAPVRGGFQPPVAVAVAPPPPAVLPVAVIDDRYRLDAGDRLRVVVFGQEGLTNTYTVGASGTITMPLIANVNARGLTPAELSGSISAKLRNGFIREPSVAVEVEAYRPFFILGEVAAPGQYPYVPNMTVESAVAIAGGYSPRALRNSVRMTRSNVAGSVSAVVPPTTLVSPGDTIVVGERWF